MITRTYYGWLMVGGLGITELVSWGVLVYVFSVLVVPMRAELGWSMAELNAVYAAGVALSGLLAIPVGRVLQLYGARGVMTVGSLATVVMLLLWSTVDSVWMFFCVFAIGGLAMATTLYEPVFAVTAVWFDRDRPRAVLVLTIFGGLASVVFIPLTGALAEGMGWRDTLVVLAVIAAVIGLPIHALLVRRHPADLDLHPDGTHDPPRRPKHHAAAASTRSVLRAASFRWLVVCMVLSTAAKFAVSVVLVAYLSSRGYSLSTASLAAGGVGLFQIGGRLIVTALRARVAQHASTACIFVVQGAAFAIPLCTSGTDIAATIAIVAFVALFGLGYGLEALLRGTLVVAYYGVADYASINGVLGAFVIGARTLGPLLAGVAVAALGGYHAVFLAAGLMCAGGGVALVLAERSRRAESMRRAPGR